MKQFIVKTTPRKKIKNRQKALGKGQKEKIRKRLPY